MSRRLAVIAVAVLLTVSTLLASHAAISAAPSAPAPAVAVSPAVSDVAVRATNDVGDTISEFAPGETIYFAVTDSDTADISVNVTITDLNATRDGVSGPYTYKAVLNTTSTPHYFDSWTQSVGYTIPANLPYDGNWTVNATGPKGGSDQVLVFVSVYSASLSSSITDIGYPGEAISIWWTLTQTANGAIYTDATNITLTGRYDGNGTSQKLFARNVLADGTKGVGEWNGTIPANATPDEYLTYTVYAVADLDNKVVENVTTSLDVPVGYLYIEGGVYYDDPGYCYDSISDDVPAGSLTTGCVQAYADWYGFDYTPIGGLPVTIAYWNGSAHVSPAGAPTSLTTNASGDALFNFGAASPPFVLNTKGVKNAVNYTVSLPGAYSKGYHWTLYANDSWYLVPAEGWAYVNVTFSQNVYYVGQTATASWTIASSNVSVTGSVDPVSWTLVIDDAVLEEVAIGGTAQSGTFSFPVTSSMVPYGGFYVGVVAANATESWQGYGVAGVSGPTILLNTASGLYEPGSTVLVSATLEGGGAGATLNYNTYGYWNSDQDLMSSGTVANGSSISQAVPSTAPPDQIEFRVWATVGSQVIATNYTYVYLGEGYVVSVGVSTISSYSDGSFQPGQSVTLSYAVTAIGGYAAPPIIDFSIGAEGTTVATEYANMNPTGTVSFTIPSSVPRGTLVIELDVGSVYPCVGPSGCTAVTTLFVNPHPSVMNLEIGAGSGVTVGWLIVLILIILVALAGLVMLLRRRHGGKMKSSGSSSSGSSTSSPSEWKEPPASSPPSGGSSPPSGSS